MKKFKCVFCNFFVRKDYNLILHYKKKHEIYFDFTNLMSIKDFIKNFNENDRIDARLMHNNILNKLSSQVSKIYLGMGSRNINHDLHEIIFHLVYQMIKNNIHHNNNFEIIISNRMQEWSKYIIILISENLKVKLNFVDNETIGYTDSIKYGFSGQRFMRSVNYYPDYIDIFRYIRKVVVKKFDLEKNINMKKILYIRKDMKSRRLINFEKIYDKFDLIIDSFSNMKIEDQIKIFYNCSHFVCPNGSCTVNIIFMKDRAKVFDIQTNKNNSWPIKFGTSKLIKEYKIYTSKNIVPSQMVDNHLSNFRNCNQDYDILFDNDIESNILNFLND